MLGLLTILCFKPAIGGAQDQIADRDQCESSTEYLLNEAFGSVGLLANLRGSEDSIRTVAKRLLSEALASNVNLGCANGCKQTFPEVIYKVAPTAFLKHSKQRRECLRLERETSQSPLMFAEQRFATLDDLNDWITNFSRGKGQQGKKLYQVCSSNCSPRYTFHVSGSVDSGFKLVAEVLCGLARDRSNKRYSLSSSLQARCEIAPR